ncbi:MAG: WD40 repeat domain-containing protein, partial [Rhodospirillales bacterium]|nr:WD40 repeat domain-containing protein [Rhodospirillales bacterium]
RQLHGHTAAVLSADFSPDGKTIVTTSADNTVLIWDADTGEELRQLRNHFDSINSAAYGLDSKTIAITGCAQMDNYICQEGFVSIWDVITGQELHQFRGHSRTILSSAYGSNQGTIVTASDDGTARIWNVATGEGLRQFTGHTGPVWSVAYSPDSKSIVTAGDDGTARIWNVATGEKLRQFTGHTGSVRSVAYSPDGKSIVTAGDDGTVRIWATDTPMHIIGTTDGTNSVWTAAYSPDNKRIFTAGCHRVDKYGRCNATSAYIWDATTGEELIRLPDFISFVNSAAYSPDGKTIAITGCDRANEYGNCNESSAYLWDIASDKELYRFGRDTDTIKFVTYSPDGKTIVITGCDRANEYGNCNESSAYLWDIAS